jgi:hypothetical protein
MEDSYLFCSRPTLATMKRTRPPLTSGLDAKPNLLDPVPWRKTEKGAKLLTWTAAFGVGDLWREEETKALQRNYAANRYLARR